MAAFCVLLVLGAGVAQAAHIHGSWLPHSGTQVEALAHGSGTGTGEEHCQLCQAMHSALPSVGSRLADTIPLQQIVRSVCLEQLPEVRWQFVMFSRPPPSDITV